MQWVTAPPSVDHSLAEGVCADVVSDLAGIGARLGLPILAPTNSRFTDPLAIVFAPANANSKTLAVSGYFNGVKTPGSPNEGFVREPCQITLYPLLYDGEQASLGGVSDRLHVILSHEVVHCYQAVVFTYAEATKGLPAFMTEGSATYLATSYAGYGEPGTASFWSQGWLGKPGRDLTSRGYDAVGWYSLVAHITGNDLWSKMVAAWRAYESGGSSAFIAALGGDSVAVEKAWGASVVDQPTWGDEWTTPGIGVPIGAQPAVVADVLGATGGSNGGTLQPWAAVVDKESSVPDGLLEISVSGGYASVHDGSGHRALGFTDEVFCVGSKPCQDTDVSCTSGGTPLNLAPLAAPFTLAVNSTDADARYTITSIASPGNRTTPVDLPPSAGDCNPAPPGNGTAVAYSEGDPHLATFNAGALDFQAAGEYTLVESRDHSLEVQVREQPVSGSSSVAEDTAFAMLVAGTRLEVDAGTSARLLINGGVTHLLGTTIRSLPGGGRVHADGQGDIFVKWPDGCSAAIETFPGGLNLFFGAPQSLVGGLHGLLNSVVPGASPLATDTVLIGGNGKRYLVDPSTNSGFRTIYGSFAPSWAVTEKDSLFTYLPGKNASSYLVKGFPERNFDAATVPPLLLPPLRIAVPRQRRHQRQSVTGLRDRPVCARHEVHQPGAARCRAGVCAVHAHRGPCAAVKVAEFGAATDRVKYEFHRPTKSGGRPDPTYQCEPVSCRNDHQAPVHLADRGGGGCCSRYSFRHQVRPRGDRPVRVRGQPGRQFDHQRLCPARDRRPGSATEVCQYLRP